MQIDCDSLRLFYEIFEDSRAFSRNHSKYQYLYYEIISYDKVYLTKLLIFAKQIIRVMLIRFVVSNFLSFDKECEFNMLPAPYKTHMDHVCSLPKIKLLRGAAIYGANGAGKSNLIKAISFLQDAVISGNLPPKASERHFKLKAENIMLPSVFDVEYTWNKKYFGYHLEFRDNIITNESLYELGFANEDKMLFERTYSPKDKRIKITLGGKEEKDPKFGMLVRLMEENILDNSKLLLSQEKMLKISKISSACDWFRLGLQVIFPKSVFGALTRALSESEDFSGFVNRIITSLDTGVSKIGVEEIDMDDFFGKNSEGLKQGLKDSIDQTGKEQIFHSKSWQGNDLIATKTQDGRYVVRYPVAYHIDSQRNDVAFYLSDESDGTRRLLDIIPAIDMFLSQDTTIIVDEINQSIHPSLLRELISKIMHTPSALGQFIITTHECNLLDHDIYRQDEIWFVEKKNGSTQMYSLSDFNPRADLKLQKGYIQGRFGAIPFLGNLRSLNWEDEDYAKN